MGNQLSAVQKRRHLPSLDFHHEWTPAVKALCTPRRHSADAIGISTPPPCLQRRSRSSTGLFAITSPRTIIASPHPRRSKPPKTLVERLLEKIKRHPHRRKHQLPFRMPKHGWQRTLDAISLLLFDSGHPTLYRIRYDLYRPHHEPNVYFVEFYVGDKSLPKQIKHLQ